MAKYFRRRRGVDEEQAVRIDVAFAAPLVKIIQNARRRIGRERTVGLQVYRMPYDKLANRQKIEALSSGTRCLRLFDSVKGCSQHMN